MQRRTLLGWFGLAVTSITAGCADPLGGSSDGDSSVTTTDSRSGKSPCDEYAFNSTAADDDEQLPWHLGIRNIILETSPVSISISDISGSTPEEVISCTATSGSHSELVFDLSPNTEYRVDVTLKRSSGSETASTSVTGWNRVTGTNESLEVTVEGGKFRIHRIHYDSGIPTEQAE